MFDNDTRTLLEKPLIARLATHGHDGYPHVVPVWFMLDGNDVMFISERDARKVKNITANSKAAVTIGGDSDANRGYMIKGECTVEEDVDFGWLKRITYHYEDKEQADKDIAEWSQDDMIAIRMRPSRVITVY
ncbi:MAG: hypothetical protein GYB67_06360 [Chloroflexi bacterium]|nr:hypothetical protein [Chloroflexota bacterium]